METINPLSVFLVLLMTILGALGAFFLKKASAERLLNAWRHPALYCGVFLYGVSILINLSLLRLFSYSLILPLTALTYVWTMLLGRFVLLEKLTVRKLLGTALIVLGAVLVV